ncbi:MAG: thioredoxin-disulfide reductase [Clostridia bacterium]|nr:thioredoxin-disulfide reductase [Clostridia bacterium]
MGAMHISAQEFQQLLKGDKPLLVDYWAPWCTYCRKINDAYDAIADQYGDRLIVAKVNIDDNEALAVAEAIELVPTLRLYSAGAALGSVIAPDSKAAIEAFIGDIIPAQAKSDDAPIHDMVIIGGGPGGYTAALYAARAGLDAVVLERLSAGGQMALTHQIDNYPGFADGVEGFELGAMMQQQAQRFGAKTVNADVQSVELTGEVKHIRTSEGDFRARTVVIATGANPRKLGVPEEDAMLGRGVAYCAACDGMFYKEKTVVVVGGGNSAAADALLLSRVAEKVIIVHRRDSLRATKVYHQPLMEAPNVSFQWDSVVESLRHGEKLTGVRIRSVKTGEVSEIPCDGLFVSIGREPASGLVKDQLALDNAGYIIAGESTETSIPGVYAVGDVRTKALRQIVTAVADGATAVHMAEQYLA